MVNVGKTLFFLLTAIALSGCIQTLKHTPVDGRTDVRLVEYLNDDGSPNRSYFQFRAPDGEWYEGERKNGVWGLSEMGRIEYSKKLGGGGDGGGGGGGGGGCGS
jgi:hypothetical protein